MDSQDIRIFIDDVYATMDISHCWIVYDRERSDDDDRLSLIQWLKAENYPLCVIDSTNVPFVETLEHSYRMFLIDKNDVQGMFEAKGKDMGNVSIILCTTIEVVNEVSKTLLNFQHDKIISMS